MHGRVRKLETQPVHQASLSFLCGARDKWPSDSRVEYTFCAEAGHTWIAVFCSSFRFSLSVYLALSLSRLCPEPVPCAVALGRTMAHLEEQEFLRAHRGREAKSCFLTMDEATQ